MFHVTPFYSDRTGIWPQHALSLTHTHTLPRVLRRFETSTRTHTCTIFIIIQKNVNNAITSKWKKQPWPGNKARRTEMDGWEWLKHIKEVQHRYGSQSIYLGLCFRIMSLIIKFALIEYGTIGLFCKMEKYSLLTGFCVALLVPEVLWAQISRVNVNCEHIINMRITKLWHHIWRQ